MPLRPKYIHEFVYMYTYILILLICMISKKNGINDLQKTGIEAGINGIKALMIFGLMPATSI